MVANPTGPRLPPTAPPSTPAALVQVDLPAARYAGAWAIVGGDGRSSSVRTATCRLGGALLGASACVPACRRFVRRLEHSVDAYDASDLDEGSHCDSQIEHGESGSVERMLSRDQH